ncbi:MAG: hypothetical protein KA807_19940 [Prolixibacteraceae bacterium]|nr:hypothetical protein [Prolixibacteraceae bacterium]
MLGKLSSAPLGIILAKNTDKQLSNKVVERINKAIIALGPFKSVSIGMSHYPEESNDVSTLITLADDRMYSFKDLNRQHYNEHAIVNQKVNHCAD